MKEKLNSILESLKKDKKKALFVGIIIIAIIAIVIILCFLLREKSKEDILKTYLEEMGVEFYEELYYPQVGKTDEERTEFLKKFTDLGIKINLDSLSRYNTEKNQSKVSEFKNPETQEDCDKENTKVIIYPSEPFGRKDYRIEINLECGF